MTVEDETIEQLPGDAVRVTARDVNGKMLSYVIRGPQAAVFLAEREGRLSDTSVDEWELVGLAKEFRALMDDVLAEDRTERLLALRERFVELRELYKIGLATEGESS